MRNTQLTSLLATILLITSCHQTKDNRDFYHALSQHGVCTEWVDDVDDKTLPPGFKRGACPQEMSFPNGDKAFRYASCPSTTGDGYPEMFVYYSRTSNADGSTMDMTDIPVLEFCKPVFD